jgi:hypothetical protein
MLSRNCVKGVAVWLNPFLCVEPPDRAAKLAYLSCE